MMLRHCCWCGRGLKRTVYLVLCSCNRSVRLITYLSTFRRQLKHFFGPESVYNVYRLTFSVRKCAKYLIKLCSDNFTYSVTFSNDFISGPPNVPVLFCTLSSVVVCNAADTASGTVRLRPVRRTTPCYK